MDNSQIMCIFAFKRGITYKFIINGIKLGATIQDSPDLKDHVIQNIDKVRAWLKANGFMDADDMQTE